MTEQTISFTVDAVTVYPDRARVTVVGETEIDADVTRLVVDDLPLTLDADSVRVAGSGTARVTLGAVDVQRVQLLSSPAQRVRELEAEIIVVQDEMQALDNRTGTLKAQLGYIDGLRGESEQYARALALGRMSVEKQAEIGRYLQTEDAALRAQMMTVSAERRDAKTRLDRLERELAQLRAQKPREQRRVVLDVAVDTAGSLTLSLTYVVRRAGWHPLYDIRLENGPPATVRVTAQAQVTQRSGQDWTNARLSISTARPALNRRLPELNTWYVDEFKPIPRPQVRAKAQRDELPAQASVPTILGAPAAMAQQAAEIAVATLDANDTARTFHVGGRSDIPSDGSPHKVVLNRFDFTAEIDYTAVPKHTDAVYRRARFDNTSGAPLLPGQASLFVGAEYIGQTQMAFTADGETVELLLGVEERLTIERELVRRDTDKRLLGDRRTLRYGYKISCHNLLEEAASLTVEDHYPVSRHEQIRVRWERSDPPPAEHSDLHQVTWKLTLPPNGKTVIAYEYTVEHPRSMTVAGLLD